MKRAALVVLALVLLLFVVVCFVGESRAAVSVGHWVDITWASGAQTGVPIYAIDSCVVYGTAGTAAGTDLRLGKATAKTRPGRAAVADSINPHWKLLVNHNSTNFPGAYGMGVSATFYTRLVGTAVVFEVPGSVNVATHTIATDTVWRLDNAFLTTLTDSIQAALTADHGAGSWTTGSGGLDSAGISRIIKRCVWGVASGSGGDSTTLLQRTTNVDAIDNSTVSPANLDEAFDNDGTGAPKLELRQLAVRATSAEDTAAIFQGADDGPGAWFRGGAGNANGIYALGVGNGSGINVNGGATGNGLQLVGGATSGRGLNVSAPGNDWGAVFTGAGTAGGGILSQASAGNGTGFSVLGFGNGAGLLATSGAGGTWPGIRGGLDSLRGVTAAIKEQIADSTYAQFTEGSNENQFKADVTTLATLTNQQNHMAWDGVLVSGFADSITQIYFPLAGAGNKDSVVFTRWAAGTPTRLGKWVFMHGTVVDVADSLRVKP